ncbi:GATA-type zinc finger protein 1 isoform X2 [Parasteatoda tepidariorum]|uniref:GATA-type zinc finger protein 1 isoform X2 n=1 Tax=Parasteatoda tepidariorum TaxID=114398 RepID=UPI00077FCD4C|nr:GATA-type zinc finger protein 1 isoform X2 [Parasteatoda tepidariorum]
MNFSVFFSNKNKQLSSSRLLNMALNSSYGTYSFINQSSSSTFDTKESGYFSETFCSSPGSSSLDLERSGELFISESSNIVGCRKRKNFIPQRSSDLSDPTFRGVTIRMDNKLVDGEWKLIIKPTFSLPRPKRVFKPYPDSSEEEDISNNYTSSNEEKHCASCSVKKTPLWRDAEDGTPLCNACGIRYKKYKMRCASCWHIPKKDEFHPRCRSCGSSYVPPEFISKR